MDLLFRQLKNQELKEVRPSFKADYPLASFERYIHWEREDGAPLDPWIRTHWKLGANIIKPIPKAFTTKGTVREWEAWTNMKFPESGSYIVNGALKPIMINREKDYGEYEDPNVWMEYQI